MSTIGQPAVSTRCIQAMTWQARMDAQEARRTGSVLKERLATRRMDAMLDELGKRLGLAPTFAPNQQRDCLPDPARHPGRPNDAPF